MRLCSQPRRASLPSFPAHGAAWILLPSPSPSGTPNVAAAAALLHRRAARRPFRDGGNVVTQVNTAATDGDDSVQVFNLQSLTARNPLSLRSPPSRGRTRRSLATSLVRRPFRAARRVGGRAPLDSSDAAPSAPAIKQMTPPGRAPLPSRRLRVERSCSGISVVLYDLLQRVVPSHVVAACLPRSL